jgi:hypothetical protein
MTAGHICAEAMGPHLRIEANSGWTFPATPVLWEHSEVDWTKDLCLVHTGTDLGKPLILADKMPAKGDEIRYVGYPNNFYTSEKGIYLGDNEGTAPVDHGASGSAVFTPQGVVGVVVRLRTDLGKVIPGEKLVPLSELRSFLNGSGVSPQDAPDDPGPALPWRADP